MCDLPIPVGPLASTASLNIPSHGLPHSKHYYIMVKNKGESYELESRSNKFEISPIPHSIEVLEPLEGASYIEGDNMVIKWNSENMLIFFIF